MIDSPELAELLREAMESRLLDVHTALPGKVTAYDVSSQTADVEPQCSRILRNTESEKVVENLPVIPSVPVRFMRAGSFFITMPIPVGTCGLLIFSEYSIDQWRQIGDQSDPGDERRHGLSGAVFVPGVYPAADALTEADNTDMRMGVNGRRIDIKPSGNVEIGAPGATEGIGLGTALDTYMASLFTWLSTHVHGGVTVGAGSTGTAAGTPSPPTLSSSKHKVEP